jgi:general stress protein YciG
MTRPKGQAGPGGVRPQGFAALSPEERREISRKGGRRVQSLGLAPHFTSASGKAARQRQLDQKVREEKEEGEEPSPSWARPSRTQG